MLFQTSHIEFKSNRSYRAPAYIQLTAKKKCNRDDIFVLGVDKTELAVFWLYNVSYHALSFTRPVEKGRAVVDIDSRCHKNTAELAAERSKDSSENGSESNQTTGLINLKSPAPKVQAQPSQNHISCSLVLARH